MITFGTRNAGAYTPLFGTITAANGVVGPVTFPGAVGDMTCLPLSWKSSNGSVPTLQWFRAQMNEWRDLYRADGSINGLRLYNDGLVYVPCGIPFQMICHSADFVAGGTITIEIG